MSQQGVIVSVNVSRAKGTPKAPVDRAAVNELGLEGDAHAGPCLRQVSLLSEEVAAEFAAGAGIAVGPGDFAENLTTRGLDTGRICLLDTVVAGSAQLRVSQLGKACHGGDCAIFRQVGECAMPTKGIFCQVTQAGVVAPGDVVEHVPRPMAFLVITLSDRASAGEYADRSGPRVAELVRRHFADSARPVTVESVLLPDDPDRLRDAVLRGRDAGADVIFTTGSTGVGPRDIAPDVVQGLLDRELPGIMEVLRVKFGMDNPRARLSRGVAGVTGCTQVYTLPGSVRAVDEYGPEIMATVEHLLYMLHGLDAH